MARQDAKSNWRVWYDSPISGETLIERDYVFCTRQEALNQFYAAGHAQPYELVKIVEREVVDELPFPKEMVEKIVGMLTNLRETERDKAEQRREARREIVRVTFHPLDPSRGAQHIDPPGNGYQLVSVTISESEARGAGMMAVPRSMGAVAVWAKTVRMKRTSEAGPVQN